jgi:hypothetical protein
MTTGRPTIYTKELADLICAEIALGFSLRTICAEESMPCVKTIFNWFRTQPGFLQQYETAKEEQADALAEEMLDIADDGTNDWMEKKNKDGSTFEVLNAEHVQRSRLRIDTRKWIASKLKPKKYGDKVTSVLTGPNDGPIQIDDLNAAKQNLLRGTVQAAPDTGTDSSG